MKPFSPPAALAMLALFAGSALRADVYEDLRQKWVNGLTGGNYTIDAAVIAKIAARDAAVAQLRSEMVAGIPADDAYLFPAANEVAASRGETQRHAHITKTYENLAKLAIALRTKGSNYEFIGTGSALAQATRDDVKRGVEWMYHHAYQNNTIQATEDNPLHNWWDLEIGATGWLGSILSCLSTGPFAGGSNGGLNQTVIDTYSRPMILKLRNPTILNGAGANGAWRARTWTYLGMLRKNRDENLATKNYLGEARARLDGALASPPPNVYNFDSEGFHPDGMFIGHRYHPYTGSYGAQMIDRLIELDEFYTGTDWPTTGILKATMLGWILSSDLQTYTMQFFQNVRGRDLTRFRSTNTTAAGLCLTTIWVAESALPADQQFLRSLVKTWLESAPTVNLLADPNLTIPQYLRAKRYYDLHHAATVPLPANDTYRQFPYGSTAVVLRPGYGASVSMFTAHNVGQTRPHIKTNEVVNGETPKGAFLTNGSLQVLTRDVDAFANGYYENLDWQRIPGTTIDRDLLPTGQRYENATNWAGGVGIGRFGVTGFQLQPKTGDAEDSAGHLGKFHARKGWFFFDKEIVALGSDIRRTDTTVNHKIHTNVENRKIRTDNANTLKIDSSATPGVMQTKSATLSATDIVVPGARRAWVSGNIAGTDMGYYFPNPTEITFRREQRNTSVPTPAPATYVNSAKYLLMWINHGIPSSGGYQYVLLPNHTEAQTNAYANNPEIAVLENSANAQAVRKVMPAPVSIEQDETLDVTGALFFNNATTTIPGGGPLQVSSSRPGALIVEETEAKIKISFSDVTWEQTGVTIVEVGKKVSGWETKASSTSHVTSTYPTIRLEVNLTSARGAGQEFIFHKRHEFGSEDDGLPLVASSGDAFVNYLENQTGADGGRLYSYNANAAGDYATFKIWHQMAGSYKAVLRFKKANNRGKVKVYLGTTSTPTTQIGAEVDLYSPAETFETVEIPIAGFAASGDRFIKFEVTGKNASSSSYRVVLDSLEFKPL
jgi:hyaluronate lyase